MGGKWVTLSATLAGPSAYDIIRACLPLPVGRPFHSHGPPRQAECELCHNSRWIQGKRRVSPFSPFSIPFYIFHFITKARKAKARKEKPCFFRAFVLS